MPHSADPILIGIIGLSLAATVIVAFELRKQAPFTARSMAVLAMTAAYFFFGIRFSLGLSFYSGPDGNGATRAAALAVAANFALGALWISLLRRSHFSSASRRSLFYSFTIPGWLLLVWLAHEGIEYRLAP
jgi:hypothetical protein